jgi:protein required for attachment to host cells
MTEHDAGVTVGDGQKSLFFRNEGDRTHPNLEIVDVLRWESPCTSDQGFDRPGRMHTSIETGRGVMQETNWRKLEKHFFAEDIADALYSAAYSGRYDNLTIAAPPTIMGDLRKAMHKEVSDKMVAEVSKDLTNVPYCEIEKILVGHTGNGATQ